MPPLARAEQRFGSISIIVPAFDEERTIGDVLAALVELELPGGLAREVIVVDDGSRDATPERVRAFQAAHPGAPIVLFEQEHNCGKGAAIRRGIAAARGEWLVVQDADLEIDPRQLARVVEPVLAGRADVVYGTRFARGFRASRAPLVSYLANRALTWCSNRLTGLRLTDMEVACKLMPTHVARALDLREARFGFEPEVTQLLARVGGLRFAEVDVDYRPRGVAQGKKLSWRDGFATLACLWRTNRRTRAVQVPSATRVETTAGSSAEPA